jgi:uracil-DNA glycosylase
MIKTSAQSCPWRFVFRVTMLPVTTLHRRPSAPKRGVTRALKALPQISLTLLIGSYAQAWHLRDGLRVNDRLRNWRAYGENSFVLPHPSWRNTAWIERNPWFETELIPGAPGADWPDQKDGL